MFEFDERGNKIRRENYQPKKVHFRDTIEHYGSNDRKKNIMYWIIIGIVVLVVIIVLVLLFKKKKNVILSSPSPVAEQRFGFRFYD